MFSVVLLVATFALSHGSNFQNALQVDDIGIAVSSEELTEPRIHGFHHTGKVMPVEELTQAGRSPSQGFLHYIPPYYYCPPGKRVVFWQGVYLCVNDLGASTGPINIFRPQAERAIDREVDSHHDENTYHKKEHIDGNFGADGEIYGKGGASSGYVPGYTPYISVGASSGYVPGHTPYISVGASSGYVPRYIGREGCPGGCPGGLREKYSPNRSQITKGYTRVQSNNLLDEGIEIGPVSDASA